MAKECVVLLHASLGSGSQWRLVERALAPEYRVHAPDLLELDDESIGGPERYAVALEADQILKNIDARFGAAARVHLVGHGFGGVVALEFARRHAARVLSATLYEPTCFNRLADPFDREFVSRVVRAVELLVERGLDAGAARMYHDFWHGPGAFDALDDRVRHALAGSAGKLMLELRATAPQSGCIADCSGITAPVRLLGGSRSFLITRRMLEGLAATLRTATLGWIDAGHMGPLMQPVQFLAALNAFLAPGATAPR